MEQKHPVWFWLTADAFTFAKPALPLQELAVPKKIVIMIKTKQQQQRRLISSRSASSLRHFHDFD